MFGLPKKVEFCAKCTLSNQRPVPVAEFKTQKNSKKKSNKIDNNLVCNACKFAEQKENYIDWDSREKELIKLCNKYRSKKNNEYDCIVPGSGGKDSRYASYILKFKYGMNPLTVTWAPHIYTDIGRKNMTTWSEHIDNYLITPNKIVQSILSKESFLNLLHPFQPFVLGQRFAAIRVAMNMNIDDYRGFPIFRQFDCQHPARNNFGLPNARKQIAKGLPQKNGKTSRSRIYK